MKIVFATNNTNKLKELQALLPNSIQLITLSDINCSEEIPETSDSIEGNAIQKANYVTTKYGYDCFADDTGLEIECLNNEPGIYSARYAGPQKNSTDNINKVLDNLKDSNNRQARFKTVITLNLNGKQEIFTGICEGEITNTIQGENGFGYDPIFKPENSSKTFAEISLEKKNKISHRGLATQQLIEFLINSLDKKSD